MQLTGFQGKIALVTGATGGIGAATATALRAAGAQVIATDLADGDGIQPLDLRDPAAVNAFVALAEAEIGPIDLVANIAGTLATGTVVETTDAAWREVFAVNTDAVFHICRAVAPAMIARGRGAIVTVSSNAAGVPRHGMAAYAASKAATTMFMRSLGLELGPHGIRCNIVAPGSTLTPMQTGMWAGADGAARVIAGQPEIFKPGIPLGKLARPEDVAAAILFLLSDQAGHITMENLYVDGGATQQG
ncbi:MAG: SDR family oxidoreductase [Paracoccaceae bacterium]